MPTPRPTAPPPRPPPAALRAGAVRAAAVVLAVLGPLLAHRVVAHGGGAAPLLAVCAAQVLLALWAGGGALLCAWPLAVAAALLLAGAAAGADAAAVGVLAVGGAAHALIFGGLAAAFTLSLRPGRVDLVTALARRVDPNWSPRLQGYTRAVTVAWAVFFAAQVAVSAALACWAPREAWSLFVNVLDLPLVAAMFAAEYAVRVRRYPDHRHVGLVGTVRAVVSGGGGAR